MMPVTMVNSQLRAGMATPFRKILANPKPNKPRASSRYTTIHSSLNTLSLHCGATTMRVPLSTGHVESLASAVNGLLKTFAEKQKAEKPKRWDPVECKFSGDTNNGEIPHFELFCNPNAHSTAFDAKVLVTVHSVDGVEVVMEATLEQVRAGVKDALLASREKVA